MFKLTKYGYMLVVMGFTGAAAKQIKIKFIHTFNWMAEQIARWNEMGEEARKENTGDGV